MNIHTDTTALQQILSSYDWRAGTNISIFPEYEEAITQLLKKPADAQTMFRLGTCLMHQHKQPVLAVKALEKALTLNNPEVFNNIAYAYNTTGMFKKARLFLEESYKLNPDIEQKAFAKRIEGQTYFAEADSKKVKNNYDSRYHLVVQGTKTCLKGTKGVEDISEKARTYNRNAVEITKLVDAAPRGQKVKLLEYAVAQVKEAQKLWDLTPEKSYIEYKGRTARTMAELNEKTHSITGGDRSLNLAKTYYQKAADLFEAAGNSKDADLMKAELKKLGSTISR